MELIVAKLGLNEEFQFQRLGNTPSSISVFIYGHGSPLGLTLPLPGELLANAWAPLQLNKGL